MSTSHWGWTDWLWANNGFPRSIMCHTFFLKRTCFDLLRTGRLSRTLRVTHVTANNSFLHFIIMVWVWTWLSLMGTFRLSTNFTFWMSNNFRIQFFHPTMFQGDLWKKTKWRKHFLEYDFSSFHSNFWQCFVKNMIVFDRAWYNFNPFFRKIDVDPTPCYVCVNCTGRSCVLNGLKCPKVPSCS